jgi:hypothetical protein
LTPDEQTWLENLAQTASQPAKSLIGRYRLLGQITGRLAAMKEQIATQLEAASPLSRYPDAEKATQDKWEDELNASIEADYRRKRSELILLLQWWMRDIWLGTLKMSGNLLALPALHSSTEQLATRISSGQASENLRLLERLQRQLNTNVQEALAFEITLLKLHL